MTVNADGGTDGAQFELDEEASLLEALLLEHGFERRRLAEREIEIRSRSPRGRFSVNQGVVIPRAEIPSLIDQLSSGVKPLSDHFGFFTENGIFELPVRMSPGKSFFDLSVEKKSGYDDSTCECGHSYTELGAVDLEKYAREDSSRRLGLDRPSVYHSPIIHVDDPARQICLELSRQSPCGILYGPGNRSPSGRSFHCGFSVKVRLGMRGGVGSDIVGAAFSLVYSFLYELTVRNRIACEPIHRAVGNPYSFSSSINRDLPSVRFPETKIGPEVAELYSFAEQSTGNPPLAFLSFYQVLEYFFPQAIRRAMIRGIRRELADPLFSGSDSDVMRIIGLAENGARANEGDQIATLLGSAVRAGRLKEFFAVPENEEHFGKKGPISGVDTISLANEREPLSHQVAKRVYKLRNRIVHAKDDPKYADVKVLLPRGREAASLRPDIELMRLLAQEVILDSQV